jgi:hypothetical protein
VAATADIPVIYGNVTLGPDYTALNYADVWNILAGDLSVRYQVDMRGATQPAPGATGYAEVGMRQVGSGNFNPGPFDTYQGGKGGWMTSLFPDLTPSPSTQGLSDKHNLSASGGRGEGDYDATDPSTIVAPLGGPDNYGFWFDRDSVDPFQALSWGAVNGGTYNTNGIYNILINYHAIDGGLGTMFATINGIPQGFYVGGYHAGEPDNYPVGLSFKGDMTQMQAFAGYWAPGDYGTIQINDLIVTGTLVPEPGSIFLLGAVAVGLAASLRRKFRSL